MFARIISLQLKPNSRKEFTELFEKEVLPTIRKQPGFKDELLFLDLGGPEVLAISLWESREKAEAYNRATYPEILKTLAKVTDGTPKVRTLQLAHSTFHKLALGAAVGESPITSQTPGVGG